MAASDDEWTTAHDLALIYSGLACVDRDLTDREVEAIEEPLLRRIPLSADTTAGEVVQKAATALKRSEKQVRSAVKRVDRELSDDERRETLQDLLQIAEADGVLLESERDLIHQLATIWDLKQLSDAWGGAASAVEGKRGADWTLLHELAFLFVQVGHSTEVGLTDDAFGVMADRLSEWQPKDADEAVRSILRRALRAFADRDEEPLIRDSVETVNAALPPVQGLLMLDDLHTIARVGGSPEDAQRRHLHELAEAWDISVRLEGD